MTKIFEMIWEIPTLDMFATVHNTQLAEVQVSDAGAASTGSRCTITTLAGMVDVRVSSVPLAEQGHSETTSHSGQQDHSDSPLGLVSATVPHLIQLCVDQPRNLPYCRDSVVSASVHRGPEVVPSARMEALMQHYQAVGFSEEVSRLTAAPRRASTNRMYDDRWLCFAYWAAEQGIAPTAAQKATFLFSVFPSLKLMAFRLTWSKATDPV